MSDPNFTLCPHHREPDDCIACMRQQRDAAITRAVTAESQLNAPPEVEQMLTFMLTRIGSWTNARWDQHMRERIGDKRAETVIRWLAERGIRPYIPEGTSGRMLQERTRPGGL